MRPRRPTPPPEDQVPLPEAAAWLKNPKQATADKPPRHTLPGLPWTAAELAAEPPWTGPDYEGDDDQV
jgi:hypothetical protein